MLPVLSGLQAQLLNSLLPQLLCDIFDRWWLLPLLLLLLMMVL
jgi:hypothetical protein